MRVLTVTRGSVVKECPGACLTASGLLGLSIGSACVRPVSCWTAFIVIQLNIMAAIVGGRYTRYLTTDSVLLNTTPRELELVDRQ